MHPSLLFARTLCGHYSNREQAQNDPSKFAHINIFFMPLPWDVLKGHLAGPCRSGTKMCREIAI